MWDAELKNACGTNEVNNYNVDQMLFKPDKKKNLDVLGSWKANLSTFPFLSVMLRDLLTPSISTGSTESTFSKSGQIISKDRIRFAPNSIEIAYAWKTNIFKRKD